jgi:N-acetylglucosamine-6-phosphate deacetylase
VARTLLTGAGLLDPEAAAPRRGSLLLEGARIGAVLGAAEPGPDDARRVALDGALLAPGFVDLHFHGPLVFAAPGDFEAALRRTCASLLAGGTTAFLATTLAWPAPELGERVTRLAALLPELDGAGAVPIGLHLEGPWISPRAAGAQPAPGIRSFEPREGEDVLARAEGLLRMVTFAPELPGAAELQERLTRRGAVAALGHSLADADAVLGAVERGAQHVTHLFNAMGPLHHRAPGLAGVALVDDRLTCDLICDGVHVDPRVVALARRAKAGRLVFISDRVELPPDGTWPGAGPAHDDGVALRLSDGRLAGSRLGLDTALRNARSFAGMTLLEAVAACSLAPARVLGIEAERGSLRPGARADLVVLDEAGAVRETWVAGRRRFPAGD